MIRLPGLVRLDTTALIHPFATQQHHKIFNDPLSIHGQCLPHLMCLRQKHRFLMLTLPPRHLHAVRACHVLRPGPPSARMFSD